MKRYVKPDMDITEFEAEDIITTSAGEPAGIDGNGDPNGGNCDDF